MATERLNKSDKGIRTLTMDVLQTVFGLTPNMADEVMNLFRRKGEWGNIKQHVRQMNAVAHRRLNQAIDLVDNHIDDDMTPSPDEVDTTDSDELESKERPLRTEKNPENDVKEGKTTFIGHLLNEVTTRDIAQQEINTMNRDERISRARMSDNALLLTRQSELNAQRTSQDPIDRQIAQLQQKIAVLRKKKEDMSKQSATGVS